MASSKIFGSEIVARIRREGNVWRLAGGELVLPRVSGFCSGVTRALAMLEEALAKEPKGPGGFFLLGEIIHNPYVNEYFRSCGVRILSPQQREHLEDFIGPDDCGVIPAFGVTLAIEERLHKVGCRILDTTCGDVRRLWAWGTGAVERGFSVLIYGRAGHDETVVTKSRLEARGGRYLVVGNLREAQDFRGLITGETEAGRMGSLFGREATNASSLEPFERLAQVSQTTMLYDDTMRVRDLIQSAFEQRFGHDEAERRLLFQPTVCRATQDRQSAALELCQKGCDLIIVVGGFGSSNTTHLYERARVYGPAYFIEDVSAILGPGRIRALDPGAAATGRNEPVEIENWLPQRRPLKIGVLAGASSPQIVIGEVLERLADLLA